MIIKSPGNIKFKYITKLKNKKYRELHNSYIVESKKLVDEAISSADVDFVFVNESNKDFSSPFEKIVFSDEIFDKLSLLTNSDGIAAVINKNKSRSITSKRVLLLDKINDPGNMGTIIRSAEAFGFNDIIYTKGSVDIYNEKTLRATMGSIFRINIKEISLEEITKLKGKYKLISADMAGYDINGYNVDENLILAIGNEANGISRQIRDLSDDFVKIPMKGKIESLNAAIAGSILMNKFSL